jgi:outer membrane protein TolC
MRAVGNPKEWETTAMTARRLTGSKLFRLSYASALTAAMLSGCESPTKLRWSRAESLLGSPSTAVGARNQANLPKRRGRSQPSTPPHGAPREGDQGLVLSAGEVSANRLTGMPAPAIPAPEREYSIDLTTALRLAEVENPRIAEARQRIGEALAVQQKARVLLLPNLNVGMNLHDHTGNLQRSSGTILRLNQSALYFGGGAGALAAGTVEVPAVSIISPLTDAIFEPLAARQQVEVARLDASLTANTILLEVAERHFELLAAESYLRARRQAIVQAEEVARLTRAYAKAGQGREADAERASSELSLIVREEQHAEEEVAVASTRLAHRLHLDQSVRVRPIAPAVETITLVDPSVPLPGLIQVALARHPAIGARAAAVAAAEVRHKQEQYRPLLPTLWLGYSGGALGGGSNLFPPELSHFAGRSDFDVQVFWTLRNFGIGNLALQKQRRAEVGQAVSEQSRAIASVRSEVSAAYAEVATALRQVEIATRRVASAEAGFQEDVQRIRNTVGRPLEVVNSLQLANEARIARIRAVTDYNKAEFRLFVSLGAPPPLGGSARAPLPPAPLAFPALPPPAGLVH